MNNRPLPIPPVIHVTYDYSLFGREEMNRVPDCVKKLIKSICKLNLTRYTPILVSKSFTVLDGQHRLRACQILGLPVFFIVADEDIDVPLAIQLLQEQKVWRMQDFLRFQAVLQGGCYANLEEFDAMWGLGLSNSMVVYPTKAINSITLREGIVHFDKNPNADDVAAFLCSPEVKALKYGRTRAFCLAVRKAFDIYNKRELQKIQGRLITIPHCADYEQYLAAFANIVKRRVRS